MDTRIGYPNEHLAGDSEEEIASPLYATAVGLLMNALETSAKNAQPEVIAEANHQEHELEEVLVGEEPTQTTMKTANTVQRDRKSIFDKWSEKLKDFLDNAE